jgi:hypothetical protein
MCIWYRPNVIHALKLKNCVSRASWYSLSHCLHEACRALALVLPLPGHVGALDLRRMLLTKLHKKRLPSSREIQEISVLRKEQLKLPLIDKMR